MIVNDGKDLLVQFPTFNLQGFNANLKVEFENFIIMS